MDNQTLGPPQIILKEIKKENIYVYTGALESNWAVSISFKMCKSSDPEMHLLVSSLEETCSPYTGRYGSRCSLPDDL